MATSPAKKKSMLAKPREPMITCVIPRAYLNSMPPHLQEPAVIKMLRKNGVPVNGSTKITGLRFGFLRADKDEQFNLTMTWFRKDPRTAEQKAAEKGVVLEPVA